MTPERSIKELRDPVALPALPAALPALPAALPALPVQIKKEKLKRLTTSSTTRKNKKP